MIYVLYGKTGAGKSTLGKRLAKEGAHFLEGDSFITENMKLKLEQGRQLVENDVAPFIDALIIGIKNMATALGDRSFVVAQALYLKRFRDQLSKAIPGIVFVHVNASELLRDVRIEKRAKNKGTTISKAYAKKMDVRFEAEQPGCLSIINDARKPAELMLEMKELMPALFDPVSPVKRTCCSLM